MLTFLISREQRRENPADLRSSYVSFSVFHSDFAAGKLSQHKMEMTGPAAHVVVLLFASVTFAESSPRQPNTVRPRAAANTDLM